MAIKNPSLPPCAALTLPRSACDAGEAGGQDSVSARDLKSPHIMAHASPQVGTARQAGTPSKLAPPQQIDAPPRTRTCRSRAGRTWRRL